jgi:hypothetical protein
MTTFKWLAGGALLAALLAAIAIAVWPTSATDRARDDGEHFGKAVAELRDAQTTSDVHDGLSDLHNAMRDTREHVGGALSEQIDAQGDAIYRAVDGSFGKRTADNDWAHDVYDDQLGGALDDLASQADDFRTTGSDVQQAFWEGVQDGLDA